jgi:hypothetical protein
MEHTISDDSMGSQKVYFFCSRCGHKVILQGQDSSSTVASDDVYPVNLPKPTLKNILDAVPEMFNATTFLMSLIYYIFASIIIFLSGIFVFREYAILIDYPAFLVVLIGLILALLLYGYNILIYFISKLRYNKIINKRNSRIDWEFILFDFREDAWVLFILSIGITIVTILVLTPVFWLSEYGLIYGALIYPVALVLVILCVVVAILRDFIPAIIALNSLPVFSAIARMIRFVFREIVNIPFYIAATSVIYFFISSILTFILGGSIFATAAAIVTLSGSAALKAFQNIQLSQGNQAFSALQGAAGTLSSNFPVSLIVLLFFVFVAVVMLLSLLVNIRQSLIAQSCWLMEENPGHSVSKKAILIVLSVFFFGGFMLSIFLVLLHGIR